MREPELSSDYLREQYVDLGKTRTQISLETGVDPVRIGTLLQKYGIKRYTVQRHGLCTHPLYVMWCGMNERCNNPNAGNYKWYGGKGIGICEEWRDFLTFYRWALANGWKKGLSLDRINGLKNYSPENCRFVSHQQQCRNRVSNRPVTVNGVTLLQCEWEERLGLSSGMIAKWKSRHDMEYAVNRIREGLQRETQNYS